MDMVYSSVCFVVTPVRISTATFMTRSCQAWGAEYCTSSEQSCFRDSLVDFNWKNLIPVAIMPVLVTVF